MNSMRIEIESNVEQPMQDLSASYAQCNPIFDAVVNLIGTERFM